MLQKHERKKEEEHTEKKVFRNAVFIQMPELWKCLNQGPPSKIFVIIASQISHNCVTKHQTSEHKITWPR